MTSLKERIQCKKTCLVYNIITWVIIALLVRCRKRSASTSSAGNSQRKWNLILFEIQHPTLYSKERENSNFTETGRHRDDRTETDVNKALPGKQWSKKLLRYWCIDTCRCDLKGCCCTLFGLQVVSITKLWKATRNSKPFRCFSKRHFSSTLDSCIRKQSICQKSISVLLLYFNKPFLLVGRSLD